MKNRILILVIALLGLSTIHAQEYKPGVHKTDFGTLKYQILYPENFDVNKKYPLLLFLHGAGERGNDNQKQLIHGASMFKKNAKDYPALYIFPQCPENSYWAKVDIERSENGIVSLKFEDSGEPTEPMSLVIDMMDSLAEKTFVNTDRIYVGGLSMGGMGTFEILSRRPEMFAAAFPICGGGNPASASKYAKNVDIWVFHGAKDSIVLPGFSTEMVIALMKAGGNPKYTLYKNANHNSWDTAFAEPDFLTWIFSKSKD